jgi:integrase
MHADDSERQIRFRHLLGPKSGVQDTLSFKRFRLSDREWSTTKRQIESILTAHRSETEHLRSTLEWVEALPTKQRAYLLTRLLADDPQFVTRQAVSLHESIDEYEAYRQELGTSANTDSQVMHDVERLKLRCPSDVTRIDRGILEDLLSELADEHGYAPNTLARHAKNWAAFFTWLRDKRKSIPRNPCDELDKSIGSKSKDEVQAEWIDQMVRSCKTTEERYWLRLVQCTGCRLREGLSLRVGDFDLSRSRIIFTETKNDRQRVNPIYPAIAIYLPELLHGRSPSDRVLTRITEHTCYDWLYELRDRVGVPQWQPPYNAFRATRANQLAADPSITPQQAGLLLGHSATVARRNYLSVEDSLLTRLAT